MPFSAELLFTRGDLLPFLCKIRIVRQGEQGSDAFSRCGTRDVKQSRAVRLLQESQRFQAVRRDGIAQAIPPSVSHKQYKENPAGREDTADTERKILFYTDSIGFTDPGSVHSASSTIQPQDFRKGSVRYCQPVTYSIDRTHALLTLCFFNASLIASGRMEQRK